jgi:hypothetical protein
MAKDTKTAETLEDVGQLAEKGSPSGRRPWMGRSATERVCDMARACSLHPCRPKRRASGPCCARCVPRHTG